MRLLESEVLRGPPGQPGSELSGGGGPPRGPSGSGVSGGGGPPEIRFSEYIARELDGASNAELISIICNLNQRLHLSEVRQTFLPPDQAGEENMNSL